MLEQFAQVVRPPIRELALQARPDFFVGVQLRGVGGEELQMETGEAATDLSNTVSFVNAGVVPDHDDGSAEMTQEVPKERTDLVVLDVLRMALEVQTDMLTLRRDRDSGDHGEAVPAIAMVNDRGLAARRPGLPDVGDQEEARLVDEDDVGTQPRSVFFTRGQSLRFQRSMASSSRSKARRSGF